MRSTLPARHDYVPPTPNRRAGLLALVLSLALGTCTDQQDPFGAELLPEPQAALVDGNGSGNRYFWLLPPLASDPRRTGPVDAAVLPSLSVVVCEWSGSACGGELARFAPGSGSDGIRLEDGGFIVNWKTSNARAGTYRIRFLAAGTELGAADVRVVDKGKDLKSVDPTQYVGVVRNSTLPIKFRVEPGAVTVVDPSVGGTVTAPDSPITLSIPAGALSSPTGITLTPLSPSVIPANDAGAPALGAVDLGPDGTTFDAPVTLTMPFDPAELPAGVPAEDLAIYLVDASGAWIELPVTIDLVNHTISAQLEHFSRYVRGPVVTRQATLEADPTPTPPGTGDTITVRAKGKSSVPTREVKGTKFDFSVADTTKAKVVSKTDKTAQVVLKSPDPVPLTARATGPYVPTTGVSTNLPVRAVQYPASLDLEKDAVTVTVLGGTSYVGVTVRDALGNPIAGAPYTVSTTAPSIAAADTTKSGVRITGGSFAGSADVWVRTTNRMGLPINERIRVTVDKLSPKLSVLAASAPAGGSATLIARMTGGPVKTLTFAFEGVQKTATPDPSTGFASATFTAPWAAGSYPITVTLPEDAQVEGASATGTLTVTKLASTLTLGAMGLTPPGTAVTLSATLAPNLSGGTVSFTAFGQTLTAAADTSGTARVTLKAPGAEGSYPVTASFAGDASRLPSSATGTLQVGLIPLSFTDFPAVTGTYGSTVTFRATLSAALSGRKVTFSVPGGPSGSVPSDASGTATLTLNLGTLPAGSHTASVTVLSDGVYQGATATTSLVVDPRATSLTATNSTATYGGTFSASATLTPSLTGRTLSWSLAGGEQLGTAVTGADGTATLSGTASLTPGSYPGVVAFAGDANHQASQASFTFTVTRRPTSLTVDAASAPYGGAVTLVARFGEAHAGTVSFDVGGTALGSAQADAQGVATLSVPALPGSLLPGTRTITATAAPTATHEKTSATGTLTISKIASSLTVDDVTANYGDMVTLTATVSAPSGGGTPVTFSAGGFSIPATTDANGVATASIKALASGTITVTYEGGAIYAPTSATGTLTVTKLASTLTLGALSLTAPGKPVTLSATLAPNLSGGTVSFTAFGQTLAAQVDASGTARVTLNAPGTQGDYPVTASFAGDASRLPSTATGTLQVGLIPLSFADFPAVTGTYSSTVTFRATLSAALSGRKVTFSVPGGPTISASTDATGTATVSSSLGALPAGSHTASATFVSDGVYQGATASTSLTVDPRATSLMATNSTATYGGTFSASATLTPSLTGRTLSWSLAGGEQLGTAVTGAGGTATLSGTASLTPGSYPGVVTFAGDANHLASQASFTLTVTRRSTSITVDGASTPYGGAVTLVARLGEAYPATVSFDVAGTALGSAPADAQGVATLSVPALPGSLLPGTRTITATAAPTATHEKTSGTGTLTISKIASSLTVDDVTANYGEMVTLTATVSAPSGGGTPVTFSAGGLSIPATTDANGVATASIKALASGTITVTYAGGAIYTPTSATGTLTLTTIATSVTPSVTADSYTYGATRTYSGTLAPVVPGAQLLFELDGVVQAAVSTDASGRAAWTAPAMVPGSHTLVIRFAGVLPQYLGSSASIALTVNKITTTIGAGSLAVDVGQAAMLSVYSNVPGKPVDFVAPDGSLIATVTTDANGSANATWSSMTPGTYTYTVRFNGDAYNTAASGTGTVIVRGPTSLSLTGPTSVPVGVRKDWEVQMSPALAGKTISLYFDGSLLATSVTNASGIAYFDELRLWTTGIRLEMIARFAGDATHSPSVSMLEVTVNP